MSPEFVAQFHPQIVHFPIALFLTYALFETLGAVLKKDFFSKAAALLLALGVISALAALYTGNQALNYVNVVDASDIGPVPMQHLSEHEDWANLTVWYFTGLLVLRVLYILYVVIKKKFPFLIHNAKYGFAILALAGSYLVFRTGQEGGEEVYRTSFIKKLAEYKEVVNDSLTNKATLNTQQDAKGGADTVQ
jgi:uncharacterized membrane protein